MPQQGKGATISNGGGGTLPLPSLPLLPTDAPHGISKESSRLSWWMQPRARSKEASIAALCHPPLTGSFMNCHASSAPGLSPVTHSFARLLCHESNKICFYVEGPSGHLELMIRADQTAKGVEERLTP